MKGGLALESHVHVSSNLAYAVAPILSSPLETWNQPIHRIRGRIEKIFGTWKRGYGLRRMR